MTAERVEGKALVQATPRIEMAATAASRATVQINDPQPDSRFCGDDWVLILLGRGPEAWLPTETGNTYSRLKVTEESDLSAEYLDLQPCGQNQRK